MQNNRFRLKRTDGTFLDDPELDGVQVEFRGKDSDCVIHEGVKFHNSRIILGDLCRVEISPTHRRGLRNVIIDMSGKGQNKMLTFGRGCSAEGVRISMANESSLSVTVGDDCMFSSNVTFRATDGHTIYDLRSGEVLNRAKPIHLGARVWVGAHATFLKGARVGDDSVVASGALVNKSIDARNVVIAGVPAKVVKSDVGWSRSYIDDYDAVSSTKASAQQQSSFESRVRTALIIRTNKLDADARNVLEKLRPFFGNDVFISVEDYSNENLYQERHLDETGVTVVCTGGRYLKENGLAYFKRVGWQCGDYAYYSMLPFLSEYDYVWLVEPDVSMNLDVQGFFQQFDQRKEDLVAVNFGRRNRSWGWYKSVEGLVADELVSGMYFPLSRLSVSAIQLLAEKRREYSQSDRVQQLDLKGGQMIPLFANDESFVATTIKASGLSVVSMSDIVGVDVFSRFSTEVPILAEEADLPQFKGKILHPVCSPEKARRKFSSMLKKYPVRSVSRRMNEVIATLGVDVWKRYSGIDPSVLEEDFGSKN